VNLEPLNTTSYVAASVVFFGLVTLAMPRIIPSALTTRPGARGVELPLQRRARIVAAIADGLGRLAGAQGSPSSPASCNLTAFRKAAA
jgi:hypothetical protein